MTAYTTVLFDLDGTLTDPKLGITKSVQFALMQQGVVEPDLDKLIPFIGPPLHESFVRFYDFDAARAEQAVADYRVYFQDRGIFENAVFPDIPAALESLRAAGKSLAVATSKPTVYSERILDHFGIRHFFDHVVGSHLDGSRTAKAEVIAAVLECYSGVDVADCVMVGDREHDVHGARAHGMDCIAVTFGYGTAAELDAARPTHSARSVSELVTLLLRD